MFILEGNIGAGKSTFLQLVSKHLPYLTVLFEPVNRWQKEIYGQSLLNKFYEDTPRWAYTLETMAMVSRAREHMAEQRHPNPFRITERSIYSGHYCFSKNCYESGFLSELEWHMYMKWFDFLIPKKCNPPSGFVYLYTTPDVAFERILKRSRKAENNLPYDYLVDIHQKHEEFLRNKDARLLPELQDVPVLILDCTQEFETNKTKLEEHLSALQAFILQLVPHTSRTNSKIFSELQLAQ